MSETTRNEMERLSLHTSGFPRDLLQRFTSGDGAGAPARSDPEEEVELNLGLSLGGRFGVDKSKLVRSSSIAAILPPYDDVLAGGYENPAPGTGRSYSGLTRTNSLPVETEDEWRKRKELQSLRRLAAKRRRSEKQLNLTRGEREDYVAAMGRVGSSPGPPFRKGKLPPSGGGGGLSSEGSLLEFGSRCRQGSAGEMSSVLQESSSGSNPSVGVEPEFELESSRKKNVNVGKEATEEDMPCVFTKGDGPNGRVVEGILYKYGKGEQVKIMCVCHGRFLSPVEFVKHAGGTDFLNPLKHIVVKPTSSFT